MRTTISRQFARTWLGVQVPPPPPRLEPYGPDVGRLERCDPVAPKDDGRRKTRPHVVEPRALVQDFVAAREVRRVAQQPRDLITRQAGVQRLKFSAQVERCGRRLKREGRVDLPIG